ncbi:MAG: YigZ family protein, partial [Clostridia bacterium]|nr:YigZ family protein [Clostridia bacterium]
MKEFTTISSAEITHENVIEKSRFIASAIHVDTVEQAVEFVEQKRKRYYDATHNCYAYIVGDKAKFSDDGEPQGTAGMPMYDCIKANNLDCVCVVVTRYFGGVKLGAGGLVRAYSGAVADVLKVANKVQMRLCKTADVTIDYSLLKTVRRAMQGVA